LKGVNSLDPDSLSYYSVILTLTVLSAIISAAETSFRTVNIRKIQNLVDENKKSAKNLSNLLSDSSSLLVTLMISNSIANVSIVTMIALEVFRYDDLKNMSGIILVIIITSLILFIFTLLLPKTYAAYNPEKSAILLAYPIKILYYIFKPFVSIVNILAKPLMSTIGKGFGQMMQQLTAEEIKTMVDMGHESGVLEQYETKIIQSALAIDQLSVNSILTPRVDIECVSVDTNIEDTISFMFEQEYSRVPVYEDNIDNIVGIIHIKDLIKYTRNNPDNNLKSVQNVMRDAFHVPENKTISDLLKEMQAKRVQMAIVSDEYGGTAGLITMEDILEEIVGEIRDEHDIDEIPLIQEIDSNSILVDAKVGVGEINRLLGLNLPNNQTIGRLVFESIGEVPKLEQTINIENALIKIHEMDGIRIQKVIINKVDLEFSEEENEISEVSS
jgi:putative hemolysin